MELEEEAVDSINVLIPANTAGHTERVATTVDTAVTEHRVIKKLLLLKTKWVAAPTFAPLLLITNAKNQLNDGVG